MIKKLLVGLLFLLCMGTTVYKVPDTFEKNTQRDWDSILYSIEHTSDTEFVLLWEGYGGDIDMALDIFNKLNHSKKHIVIRIVGRAVSSHALVYCYARGLVEFNKGVLVLHNAFDGRNKDGSKDYTDRTTRHLLDQCITTGILTQKEADKIIENKLRLEIYPNYSRMFYKDWG